jgi:serine protease Do
MSIRAYFLAISILFCAAAAFGDIASPIAGPARGAEASARGGPSEVFKKPTPQSISDLLAIERRVTKLVEALTRSTVAVGVGQAQGSGVIVSAEGHVLTAAHVAQAPGRAVKFILSDGRRVAGRTLGLNRDLDCGMLKITEPGPWPHVEIGNSNQVRPGDWCVAMGHPRGHQDGRAPVLRLGRVVAIRDSAIQTDCTLAAGDSGGPLFDMDGRVIGIHSRIGPATIWNLHVPASTYAGNWDRLLAAERWGGLPVTGEPFLGVRGTSDSRGCRISDVIDETPAKAAGLRIGDVIVKIDAEKIASFDELFQFVKSKNAGDRVRLEILRGGETVHVSVVLASRGQ